MPLVRLENFQQFQAINVLSDPGSIGGPKVVPQCAQIILVWNLADAKFGTNVLGGRYAGAFAGTPAQANSILTALTTGGAWTALAAFIHPTAALTKVRIRNIAVPDQPFIESTSTGALGTAAGNAMPSEVAAVITLRTGLTGPSGRGRIYVPGWANAAWGATDTILAGAVTALGNWANTIPGALTAGGYTFTLALPARQSYVGSTGTVHPARVAHTQDVTSQVVLNNTWDSQRRRGRK